MLDGRQFLESLLDGIELGVTRSLEQIKNDAQRRAPVRRLFKGGGRRRITGAIGVRNQIGAGTAYFRTSRVGQTPEGRTIRGRTNSAAPVTSPSRGSRRMPIGSPDFREVSREGSGFVFKNTRRVGREILASARSDVARGRGLRNVSVDASGKGAIEYGGTLRDSIKVIGPRRTPLPGVVGYVSASATEHGFNYAYAQEFGTAHNAPQPFLRPALRNAFRRITETNRDAIRTTLERGERRIRVVPGSIELHLEPGGSFSAKGGGSALARVEKMFERAGFR
jgi:hypothetical protein